MKKIAVILSFIISISIYAKDIDQIYPSYSYVFSEFDIDDEYIYDKGFIKFVKKNQKQLKRFYKKSIKRGGYLIPTFKNMLLEDNLSDLLVYLAMVESGFKLDAVSPKSATGIWQFMSATAKAYNLSVDSYFDERLDPILATNSAMAYLHKLYGDFGKWYLAVMAYNAGEGRVQKAIKKAKTKELNEVIKYLPKETQLYIKKILLVAMIGENISLGLEDDEDNLLYIYGDNTVQVEVEAGEKLSYVAKMIKMKPKKLLKLNPHFKSGTVPVYLPKYNMNIPKDKLIDFYTLYSLKKELDRASKCCFISHTVKEKESLESISKKYDIQISDLIKANSIKNGKLDIDQLLVIPVTKKIFKKFYRN